MVGARDPGIELAFIPRTITVTLLNDGGKYVAIDLKHIPQGGTCRMDKDARHLVRGSGPRRFEKLVYSAVQYFQEPAP